MLPQHPSFSDCVQAFYFLFKCAKKTLWSPYSSVAERFHGKEGVIDSNLIRLTKNMYTTLKF